MQLSVSSALPHAAVVRIADTENGRIRAVDAARGAVRTLAGSGAYGVARDGSAAQALLRAPAGLAWHAAASALYVADDASIRVVRRASRMRLLRSLCVLRCFCA
jgi:hypothetical protein